MNIQKVLRTSLDIHNTVRDMADQFDSCESRIMKLQDDYKKLRRIAESNLSKYVSRLSDLVMKDC